MTSFLGLPAFSGNIAYTRVSVYAFIYYVTIVAKLDICSLLKLLLVKVFYSPHAARKKKSTYYAF